MSSDNRPMWRKTLALLRPGAFRRYIIGSFISDSGTWMQMMAQGYVMSTLTDRAILLGLANFFAGLPTLALTPMGGSAADRHDKRKILIATQIIQIILAIAFGVLVMQHSIQIWHIMGFSLVLGIAIAFEMPALSALVPELVKKEEIAAAVALDRSVFHGSRLIGPSIAGFAVARLGPASAFFANAFSFIALIISLMSLPKRTLGTDEEEAQRRSGIAEGFRYVRSNRIIMGMIVLIALNTVFIFPAISAAMLPLYVRNVLHLGPQSLGWLMAVSGTGAFLGSIGLLTVERERRLKFMSANVLGIALGIFVMSRSNNFLLTAAAMGVMAVALSMNFGLANTIVQEHAPAPLRGRVSAVFGMSFFGLMPIGGLVIPGVSDLIGMRTAMMISSIIYGVSAFWVLSLAGRHVCDQPESPLEGPEAAPVA